MKKLIICIALLAGALAAYAGTLDGTTDAALAKSLAAEWRALDDAKAMEMSSALYAAFEQLQGMKETERCAKLNAKTTDELVLTAKELSPDDFACNTALLENATPEERSRNAAMLRRALETAATDRGFNAFLDAMRKPLSLCGNDVALRVIGEKIAGLPDQKKLEAFAIFTTKTDVKIEDAVNRTLVTDGPEAMIAKFKELAPDQYAMIAGQIAQMPPEKRTEMLKALSALFPALSQAAAKAIDGLGRPAEAVWLTDLDSAKKQAAAEHKPLFVLFSGSDWCPWCIKLKKEVLDSPEFESYAKDNLVLAVVDFPRANPLPPERAAINEKISEQYKIGALPTVLLMNADGKVIGKGGGKNMSPEKYVASLKKILKK